MITYTDFLPSADVQFIFPAVFDGAQYNVSVSYNIFGERYYVDIYDTSGTLILSRPMDGSPIGYDISLTAGHFTSTLVYRTQNNQFEVSDQPISYPTFGILPKPVYTARLGIDFIIGQSLLT